MKKDPEFLERWEFRRRGDELSSSSDDDSKSSSSCDAHDKKQDLLSCIVLSQCVESNNEIRARKRNHQLDNKFRCAKAAKKQKDTNKKRRRVHAQTAIWDDLKTFRESVLGELKVAREKMFTHMKDDMEKLLPRELVSKSRTKPQNTIKRQPKKKSEVCRRDNRRSRKPTVGSLKKTVDLDSNSCHIKGVKHEETLKAVVGSCNENQMKSNFSVKKPVCVVNDSGNAISASYPALSTLLNNMVPSRNQLQTNVITADKDSNVQKGSLGMQAKYHTRHILSSQSDTPSGSYYAQVYPKIPFLYGQNMYNASHLSSQFVPEKFFSGEIMRVANNLNNHMGYGRNGGPVSFTSQNYSHFFT
ncbi:unnamed protein product [Cuscuta campestris]|uniref:Uncharacterized protein n=2 Tax=Cuscuta sect. Cleistogrammica TaxID=1824901 RepID=A0A484KRV7_9ASTE|nr:hypothetical protein DM860_005418 [Cuscuta australis]VFQ68050.1 unnamed protein product [Cuscuta campestris]